MEVVPDRGLRGRRVIVTGAASGIGRATALRVVKDGARAALMDLSPEEDTDVVAAAADVGRVHYWSVDLRQEAQVIETVASAADWLGGIDVLLHIAGVQGGRLIPVDGLSLEVWEEVIGANLTGSLLIVKHVVPFLEVSGGALVLTSSGAGIFVGHGSNAYGASKGGVHGLALTLEDPLRERGIRVNEVAPGSIDTPLTRREVGAELMDTRVSQGLSFGPEGVAAVMAFLASSDADHVRGLIRTW